MKNLTPEERGTMLERDVAELMIQELSEILAESPRISLRIALRDAWSRVAEQLDG